MYVFVWMQVSVCSFSKVCLEEKYIQANLKSSVEYSIISSCRSFASNLFWVVGQIDSAAQRFTFSVLPFLCWPKTCVQFWAIILLAVHIFYSFCLKKDMVLWVLPEQKKNKKQRERIPHTTSVSPLQPKHSAKSFNSLKTFKWCQVVYSIRSRLFRQ